MAHVSVLFVTVQKITISINTICSRRWLLPLLTLALLPLLPLTTLAQGDDTSRPAPIILTDQQEQYPLGLHLELLEDPTGQLTIDQVSSPAYDDQFIPSQEETPNLGYRSGAIWARFHVRDQADRSANWQLAVEEWRLGYVDLYIPAPDGTVFEHEQAGRFRPFIVRDVPYHYGVFNLRLPRDQAQTIYLRVQSASPTRLPLTLWSLAAFTRHSQIELLVNGLFCGLLLAILGYNLLLFAALRDYNYLYLTMIIAGFGLTGAFAGSLVQQYLWPAWRDLYGLEIAASLGVIGTLLFAMNFLHTKVQTPRLHIVMLALMGLVPFNLALRVMWSSNRLGNVLLFFSVLTIIIAGCLAWWRGYRPARYFLLAWLLLFGTLVINFFVNTGLLANNLFGPNSVAIGIVLMALLLSLALADRINLLKAETDQANLALEKEMQQRESIQQTLSESEKKYRTVVEQGTEGILVFQDGQRKYHNPVWLEMTGYSAEEYEAIPFLSLVHADDVETAEKEHQKLVAGQESGAISDFRITTKSGNIKWLSVRGTSIEWEGKPAGMVFIKDITERKQAEEALQERKERYRLALETGRIAMWQMDLATGQWEIDGRCGADSWVHRRRTSSGFHKYLG